MAIPVEFTINWSLSWNFYVKGDFDIVFTVS